MNFFFVRRSHEKEVSRCSVLAKCQSRLADTVSTVLPSQVSGIRVSNNRRQRNRCLSPLDKRGKRLPYLRRTMDVEAVRKKLERYGQSHLLRYWQELSTSQRKELYEDVLSLDLEEVQAYFSRATSSGKNNNEILDDKVQPIPRRVMASSRSCGVDKLREHEESGLREIAEGRVAVLLMAGGQGTRLGVTYPKGMYDVGLPSRKTLFKIQAQRILRLETIAEEKFATRPGITWYILTSKSTNQATLDYFEDNDYFGLKRENVRTFSQGMIPCYNFKGEVLLDEKYRVSRAPDGNGGIYRALRIEGILDDMEKRGIRSVHAHSVDNILVKVADPVFVGYCLSLSADCGAKVVEKSEPSEPVGVICQVDGHFRVVEYSEISKETSELRRDDGKLVFNAGNICNHYFTLDFLRAIADTHETDLELHVAKKKIPYVDEHGVRQVPTSSNGIKVEKFVFDVFKYSKNFAAWEVPRDEEFSALKNSDSAGQDCPSTARRDLMTLHRTWLLNAGATSVNGDVEISPLLSYAGENLKATAQGKAFQGPAVLE